MEKLIAVIVKYNKPLKQISFILSAVLAAVSAYTDYMEQAAKKQQSEDAQ